MAFAGTLITYNIFVVDIALASFLAHITYCTSIICVWRKKASKGRTKARQVRHADEMSGFSSRRKNNLSLHMFYIEINSSMKVTSVWKNWPTQRCKGGCWQEGLRLGLLDAILLLMHAWCRLHVLSVSSRDKKARKYLIPSEKGKKWTTRIRRHGVVVWVRLAVAKSNCMILYISAATTNKIVNKLNKKGNRGLYQ